MNPPGNQSERRKFQRIPFEAEITIEQGKNFWRAQLVDIALRGVLTTKPGLWEKASEQEPFHLVVKLEAEYEIYFTGTLRHVDDDRLGFHCEQLDIESATMLRRLIELNLGDPKLLDREFMALLEEAN